MMKKKLFCTFFVFVILAGVAHGSHYIDLNEPERRCCYFQRENDPTSDQILCRVGSCECSSSFVNAVSCLGIIAVTGTIIAIGVANRASNPDAPVFNNTSSTGMSSFAAIQPSKPSVAAMQRDSSFEQLHSGSNSTHIVTLIKRKNKKSKP